MAQRENISIAQAIRNAVDAWLDRQAELSQPPRWRRSLSVIGKYDSGLSDVAENHDKYLAEAYANYKPRDALG
ncbi:MAG: CopG family transcriptional regulator [Anaerolineae bacterium]